MITLNDFVKDSLKQIVEAVEEFNAESNASTYPVTSGGVRPGEWTNVNLLYTGVGDNGEAQYAVLLDFDVAVTAIAGDKVKAGGKVNVVSIFKADGSMEATTQDSSVSRIKFRIPLQMKKSKTKSAWSSGYVD